jgi:hypothetical protein
MPVSIDFRVNCLRGRACDKQQERGSEVSDSHVHSDEKGPERKSRCRARTRLLEQTS